MNCLVLGGSGFIGAHLVKELIKEGHKVRVLGRHIPKVTLSNVEWYEGDFNHAELINEIMDNVDIVYHLISTTLPKTSNDDILYDLQTNVGPTIQLLETAVKKKVKKIVYFSSGGTVYGIPNMLPITEEHSTNPICAYGIHKLMEEKYLSLFHYLHNLDYAVLRISNPYGEGQSINKGQGAVGVFLNRIMNKKPIEIWGDGSVIRDYIHVSDVVNAAIKAAAYEGKKKVFNIGSGEGISLQKVVETIQFAVGYSTEITYRDSRAFDVPSNILAIANAQNELGWVPLTDFDTGITQMVQKMDDEL